MTNNQPYKNAVLDDKELQEGLKKINPKFGDFVTRVAGEVWGLPLIDQKTKALITIAVDVVNQSHNGPGNPFPAHIDMALKQGATREEIEELLLFMCVYAGFNKVAGCFGTLKEIFQQIGGQGTAVMTPDYATRERQQTVAFYTLLWKKQDLNTALFSDYWRNVNGSLGAQLPGQYQNWQHHLDPQIIEIWPTLNGIKSTVTEIDRCDGIAEITFASESDRQAYFQSAYVLENDGKNLFSKAVGYTTSPGNSVTYVDRVETGDANGAIDAIKLHVLVKKTDGASLAEFRQYMSDTFAPAISKNQEILKFRLHLFDARPHAPNDPHYEAPEKQYQAAFEIAFADYHQMQQFFTSKDYLAATKDQGNYIKEINALPERSTYTFVDAGQITQIGKGSSRVTEMIANVGTNNHNSESSLSNGNHNGKSSLAQHLQGVQHFGITVDDMDKAIEFYTEVLGGKIAIGGDGFYGEDLHNLLFQKEELEALQKGINPRSVGVPNIRDNTQESLDVRFISFGNTCVEVIHFRDAKLSPKAPNVFSKIPSSVGFANVPHISFHVKDDVDLNDFAQMLEDECQKRGMTNVVVNKTIHVNSEAERRKSGLSFAKTEFPGDFDGWALFYCKGPNGEQLEFNQVRRTALKNFKRAQQEYNQLTGRNFPWASEAIKENGTMMTATATKWEWPHTKKWPKYSGSKIDILKQLFLAGEAMNVNNFVEFFTEDCLYQFGNFPVVYGKQGIKDSSAGFLEKCEGLHHHIKNVWQLSEELVIIEMEVTYVRHDGKVFTLPCADTVRFKGDKISELRIFMDIMPMFTTP